MMLVQNDERQLSQSKMSADNCTTSGERRTTGPLSVSDKIDKALELKEQGNEKFKAKEFKKASVCYSKVFAYINGLSTDNASFQQYADALGRVAPTSEENARIAELRLTTNLNLAMVQIKLLNARKALGFVDAVLSQDPNNLKAKFRQGQCYIMLKDLDRAKAALTQASAIDPNNAAVKAELRKLQTLFKAHHDKEKRKFAGLFDRAAREEEEQESGKQTQEESVTPATGV